MHRSSTLVRTLMGGMVVAVFSGLTACVQIQPRQGLTPRPFSSGQVTWRRCPRLSPIMGQPRGQCHLGRVPLRWDRIDAPEIEVLVQKLEPEEPRRGTLWVLDGGPGGTGAIFNTPFWRRLSVERGFALLIPTHRGAGVSTGLRCPVQQASKSAGGAWVRPSERRACAEHLAETWGNDLAGFTTYEAARDVAHFIARERRPGEATFLYGGSYGSYWAQRVLEVLPFDVTGVILEAAIPRNAHFGRLSESVDEAVQRLLQRCARSRGCARRFDGDPIGTARRVVEADLVGQGCAARLNVSIERRQTLFAATMLTDPTYRVLLAPLLFRWDRCRYTDRFVLEEALRSLPDIGRSPPDIETFEGTIFDPLIFDLTVADNIVHLDLMKTPLGPSRVAELERTMLATNPSARDFVEHKAVWPDPPYPSRTPSAVQVRSPILVFAGELDARTPLSWSARVAEHYDTATLVVVPWAGHTTSRLVTTPGGTNCTLEAWRAFMDAPEKAVDETCFAQITPLDLSGTSGASGRLAEQFLGTRRFFQ
ncbi:MAG: alpha/beta hydrolase [Myxococcota bacterium]